MEELNKRKIITVSVIVVILAITAVVIGWMFCKNSQPPAVTQTTQSQPVPIKQAINLYKNPKLGFEIKLPDNWTSVIQNDDNTLTNIIFYDGKYETDVKKADNPILTIIDKNIPSVSLDVNSGDFVKPDFDIKSMVTLGAGGPEGKVYSEKLLSWNEKVTATGQKFYVYTKEIQASPVIEKVGAIWITNGKLFELKGDNPSQQSMIENIVTSFTVIEKSTSNEIVADQLSPSEIVSAEANKYPELKNFQKYDAPGVFWKNENKNVICLNNAADEVYATVKGKAVVENLVNKVINNLKQQGFVVNQQNTAGSNKGTESRRIGLEKDLLKCTIIKSANEQRNDTTKNKYFFSFGCAKSTDADENNYNTFNSLVNKGPGTSVVCVNKNNGSFMSGGAAGFEDNMGPIAGATVLGKNVNGKWEMFIAQDMPPCSFADGFPKNMYDGNCLDKNKKERKSL